MVEDRKCARIGATMTAMDELEPGDVIVEVHSRVENESRCRIEATVRGGRRGPLLAYFPDEVAFLAHELIGLTVEEARMLHGGRDRAYLDAPGYLRQAEDDQLGR